MSYTVKQIKTVAAKFLSKDLTGKLVDEFSELEPAKSGRAKKDPNAPKGAKSAYILFTMENRTKLQKKNKNKSNAEVTKLLGEEWKGLSDKKKGKYEALAAEDKKRFEKEKKSYEKKNPEVAKAKPKSKTAKAEAAKPVKSNSKVDRTSYDQLIKLSRADLSAIVKEMKLGKVPKAAGNTRGSPTKEDYAKAISKVAKKSGAAKPKPEPKAKKPKEEESAEDEAESDELETGVESDEESDSKVEDDEAESEDSKAEAESEDSEEQTGDEEVGSDEEGDDEETVEDDE